MVRTFDAYQIGYLLDYVAFAVSKKAIAVILSDLSWKYCLAVCYLTLLSSHHQSKDCLQILHYQGRAIGIKVHFIRD
jgi:hypothetical protein